MTVLPTTDKRLGMQPISIVLALHVTTGAIWTLATLVVAALGTAGPLWLRSILAVAVVNMLAGVDLWHALHRGAWGRPEHFLVVGTFCAFVALGLQTPIALMQTRNERRLGAAPLAVYRITTVILLTAATAMLGSRYA